MYCGVLATFWFGHQLDPARNLEDVAVGGLTPRQDTHGWSWPISGRQQKSTKVLIIYCMHIQRYTHQFIFVLLNLCARPFSQLKFSSLLDVITCHYFKARNVMCAFRFRSLQYPSQQLGRPNLKIKTNGCQKTMRPPIGLSRDAVFPNFH